MHADGLLAKLLIVVAELNHVIALIKIKIEIKKVKDYTNYHLEVSDVGTSS